MAMVFTITFNNITAISYRSALLVEEVTDNNVVSSTNQHDQKSNSQHQW